MAAPTPGTTTVAAGTASINLGRVRPSVAQRFVSVSVDATDQFAPPSTVGQTTMIYLHGSGTAAPSFGTRMTGVCPAELTYLDNNSIFFAAQGFPSDGLTMVSPWDRQTPQSNGARRESYWIGWTDSDSPKKLKLYTEKRLDLILLEIEERFPQLSPTKRILMGHSMGGWGTMTYGIRRANKFAALYPIQPRFRYSTAGKITLPDWDATQIEHLVGSAPAIADAFGGGSSAAHLDHIAYVSNAANPLPWIGWCVGRQDGYMPFQDHIDFVAAMRATGRGFAFAWNNGDHSAGGIPQMNSEILPSYQRTKWEIGKGYPVFTNHSGDQDPAVDLVGGINIGLSFRNVVETSSTWSCEVTSILGARTVSVKPKSTIYTGNPSPQNITIPAANSWVTVNF